MRTSKLVSYKDIKTRVTVGGWIHRLPPFLRGGLNSRRRRFWVRLSSINLRLNIAWRKFRRKEVFPLFEVVSCPMIKLSDIKERRFHIVEESLPISHQENEQENMD